MGNLGKHLIINISNFRDISLIDDINVVYKLFDKISSLLKTNILAKNYHQFETMGITVFYMLSTSHVSYHSFPEYNSAAIDIYSCSGFHERHIINEIKKILFVEKVNVLVLSRDSSEYYYKDITVNNFYQGYYMIKKTLYSKVTDTGQHVEINKLNDIGTSLFIDGELQISEKDEYIYSTHWVNESKKRLTANGGEFLNIAIFGGGDGGIGRESLSQGAKNISLLELDRDVINICKKYFPKVHNGFFDSPNTRIIIGDAFINYELLDLNSLDCIFIDITTDFILLKKVKKLLTLLFTKIKPGGMITIQIGPKWDNQKIKHLFVDFIKDESDLSFVNVPSFSAVWEFLYILKK